MLERALHYIRVPSQLLLLLDKGHPSNNYPWHRRIKIRVEIKWLQLYGYNSTINDNDHIIDKSTFT